MSLALYRAALPHKLKGPARVLCAQASLGRKRPRRAAIAPALPHTLDTQKPRAFPLRGPWWEPAVRSSFRFVMTRLSDSALGVFNGGASGWTRTTEGLSHLIYSQVSLPLEYRRKKASIPIPNPTISLRGHCDGRSLEPRSSHIATVRHLFFDLSPIDR